MNNNRLWINKGGLKYLEPKWFEQISKTLSTIYVDNHGLIREVYANKLVKQRYLIIAVPLEHTGENNSIKCFGQQYTLVLFIKKIFNSKILPLNFFLFYGITSHQSFFNISDSRVQDLFGKKSLIEYNNKNYCLFRFNSSIS